MVENALKKVRVASYVNDLLECSPGMVFNFPVPRCFFNLPALHGRFMVQFL